MTERLPGKLFPPGHIYCRSGVGTVGGGMVPDLGSESTGGMRGGTMGGSRESDGYGGLSGGMRSGMGHDASGDRGEQPTARLWPQQAW